MFDNLFKIKLEAPPKQWMLPLDLHHNNTCHQYYVIIYLLSVRGCFQSNLASKFIYQSCLRQQIQTFFLLSTAKDALPSKVDRFGKTLAQMVNCIMGY